MTEAILHDRSEYENDKVIIKYPSRPSFEIVSKRA